MRIIPPADRQTSSPMLFASLLDEQLLCFPTDTIYGVGGIATPGVATALDRLKHREPGKYYSVLAPHTAWIEEHCVCPPNLFIDRGLWYDRHGPITVILRKRDPSWLTRASPLPTLGIRRLPHHPLQTLITERNIPLLATSCNHSKQPPFVSPQAINADPHFANTCSYCLDGWPLSGHASTLIDAEHPDAFIKR